MTEVDVMVTVWSVEEKEQVVVSGVVRHLLLFIMELI